MLGAMALNWATTSFNRILADVPDNESRPQKAFNLLAYLFTSAKADNIRQTTLPKFGWQLFMCSLSRVFRDGKRWNMAIVSMQRITNSRALTGVVHPEQAVGQYGSKIRLEIISPCVARC